MKNLIKNRMIPLFCLNFNLKMKLTTFLLIISIFKIEASNYAQNTKITLNLNNVTIEKVLKEIEMKTEFKFLFSKDDVNVNKLVSVNVRNEKVKDILNKIFLEMPVSFELLNKQIIIKNTPKEKEENPINLLIDQQNEIKGLVTDSNGTPLPGVSIIVVGTSRGTTTDFDGNYSIKAELGEELQFNFIGMKIVKQTVSTSNNMNIVMQEDAQGLDEVMVTAFGRKITRNESTASVTTVSRAQLAKISSAVDAREALEGNVPGLVLTQTSGSPGAEPVVRIRGQNSITASNNPLYVIDGVPVNTGSFDVEGSVTTSLGIFSLINSADIESISVLKDASAVAPYGADGSNGVILITTKSGRGGDETTFNINTSIGYRNDAITGITPMKTKDRMDAMRESVWNSFGNGEFGDGTLTSRDQIDDYMNDNLADHFAHWESIGKPDFNWKKALTNKNAMVYDFNFSALRGDEHSNFYASVGYNKTEGTTINTDMQRITGFIKYSTEFYDRFKLNISGMVGSATQNGEQDNHGTSSVSLDNLNYSKYALPSMIDPYLPDGSYRLDGFAAHGGDMYNPIFIANNNIHNKEVTRGLQNTQLTVDIIEGLQFKTTLGMDFTLNYSKDYYDPRHGEGESPHGRSQEVSQRAFNYTTQNSLSYDFKINDKHGFNILALQEYTKYRNKLLSASGENFATENLTNLSTS